MPFNWGAFGGGLTQGFTQAYQGAQDRALKRRMLDIQMQKAQREADLSNFYDQVAKQMTAPTATMNPGYSVESPENSPTFARVPFQQPPLPDIGRAAAVTQPDTRTLMKAAAVRGGHFTSPVFSQEPQDLATQLKALEGSGVSLGNQGTHQLSVGLGPTGTRLNVRPTPQHSAANEAYWATKRAGGSEQEALQAALDFQARQAETRSFNTLQGQVNAQTGAPQGTPLAPGGAALPALPPRQAVLPPSASGTAPGMIGTKSIQDMTVGELMGNAGSTPAAKSRFMQAQSQKAAATKEGQLNAASTPEALAKQTAIAAAKTTGGALPAGVEDVLAKGETLSKTLEDVRANYDPAYVGPLRGTDTAFEGRRRFGSAIGMPATGQEVKFRQALADAKNQIIYLMSGKQINEAEGRRLIAQMPAATDEPNVFLSGLDRFETQIQRVLQAHKQAGTATRSDIRSGTSQNMPPAREIPPPPIGWKRAGQ